MFLFKYTSTTSNKKGGDKEGEGLSITPPHSIRESDSERGRESERNTQELAPASAALK